MNKIIAMYPGRFQPFHPGHLSVYKKLKSVFPETKIVTTDKTDDDKSPFNFEEKIQLMQLAGVPLQDIVQVKSPYTASEVLVNYDPENTAIVFAISKKDMDEDPRFSFKPQKSGKPSYFQPWPTRWDTDMNDLVPFGDPMKPVRAYVSVVPVQPFRIRGIQIDSASQIREMFAEGSWYFQHNILAELYGIEYSYKAHDLWQKRLHKNYIHSEKSKPSFSMSQSLIKNSDQCLTPLSAMPLLS